MTNPVLVEVTRGARVESRHRGAVAIVDAHGKLALGLGDIDAPIFPRSAVKAIQALPLVESGAADSFGFQARELALAQASHGGEPAHVDGVAKMLAAIGLDETALECGAHAPSHGASANELMRRGRAPSPLHNNCSGKHAGFLAVARHEKLNPTGYVTARHPVQERVREALVSLIETPHDSEHRATDGCSIPTYAAPCKNLARAFARFATGLELPHARAAAARRIYEAAVAEPFYIAGSGKFCTDVTTLMHGAVLVKTGAEGVFCAAIGGFGLGVALKADDGSTRGAEAMMAAVLARLFPDEAEALRRWTNAPVLTRRGARAGEISVNAELFAARS